MSRCLRWCFTINNYSDAEFEEVKTWLVEHSTYAIVGKEVGESNTPHLQGFMILKSKKNLVTLKE